MNWENCLILELKIFLKFREVVKTPVLFITFVRPDYARKTFDSIRAAQPSKLYFYSNKGRIEKEGEIERNEEIRSYISEVDWSCELHIWFRDECVNVYDSLRGAITWLFDNEEQGIILEEDCVPTMGFFSFCDQLIEKFRDDTKVWMISGDNYISYNPEGYDYIYSYMFQIYGWASWRDRWNKIDWDLIKIDDFLKSDKIKYLFPEKKQCKDRIRIIKDNVNNLRRTKCWDGIFHYTMFMNNAMCIYPKVLLVSNIGLVGTHNKSKEVSIFNTKAIYSDEYYSIKNEPPFPLPSIKFENKMYKITWQRPSFPMKVYLHFRSLINRLFQ